MDMKLHSLKGQRSDEWRDGRAKKDRRKKI